MYHFTEVESNSEKGRILDSPLYPGSSVTVRQAVVGYVKTFVDQSISKATLTKVLKHAKLCLPDGNLLPDSYARVKSLISEEIVPLTKIQVCTNDCMFYRGENANLKQCTNCGENRYKEEDALNRKVARRYFTYCSIGDSLNLLFQSSNIAQIMQEAGGCQQSQILYDIKDSETWRQWMVEDNSEKFPKIVFGFNTDGVNPFHSQGTQYSMWPLIFCIMNLPSHIRNKPDAFVLAGVVPSKDSRLNAGLEPDLNIYFELVVDELIGLASTEMYSDYEKAPVQVKVSLLLYMMDFQGLYEIKHTLGLYKRDGI